MAAKFKKFIKDFEGKEVCIGAKDGTGFMYIGPWNDQANDLIKDSIKIFKDRMERSIPVLYKNMECMAKYSYEFKDTEDITAEQLLVQHCEEVGRLAKKYRKAKAYVKSFKDLDVRFVLDTYTRNTDGRMVIMISGSEVGNFWLREEVQQFQIMELRKKHLSFTDISQILGISVDEINALLKKYEDNKKKAKVDYKPED